MCIVSYIMKTVKAMGALLKEVAAEIRTEELRTLLKRLVEHF